MSLTRFLFWWTARELFYFAPAKELSAAFAVGVSFDLLVLGFLLIPVVVGGSAAVFAPVKADRFYLVSRIYLGLAWVGVTVLAAVDAVSFPSLGRHLRRTDVPVWTPDTTSVMTVFILFCIALVGLRSWTSAASGTASPRYGFLRWAACLLAVALMARGTVTAHHLGREHTEISPANGVRELVMNSAWALDKDP